MLMDDKGDDVEIIRVKVKGPLSDGLKAVLNDDLFKKATADKQLSYSAIGALSYLISDFKQMTFTSADLVDQPHRDEMEKALFELTHHGYLTASWD